FLAPRDDATVILSKIRQQLFHHHGAGRQNVIDFEDAFLSWDSDGDRKVTHFEFERALFRYNLFI
ncbi:unnamed protein product, partial [Choristocarpus tenellus]